MPLKGREGSRRDHPAPSEEVLEEPSSVLFLLVTNCLCNRRRLIRPHAPPPNQRTRFGGSGELGCPLWPRSGKHPVWTHHLDQHWETRTEAARPHSPLSRASDSSSNVTAADPCHSSGSFHVNSPGNMCRWVGEERWRVGRAAVRDNPREHAGYRCDPVRRQRFLS